MLEITTRQEAYDTVVKLQDEYHELVEFCSEHQPYVITIRVKKRLDMLSQMLNSLRLDIYADVLDETKRVTDIARDDMILSVFHKVAQSTADRIANFKIMKIEDYMDKNKSEEDDEKIKIFQERVIKAMRKIREFYLTQCDSMRAELRKEKFYDSSRSV